MVNRVQNKKQPIQEADIINTLQAYNEWWVTEKVPPALLEPVQREEFSDIINHLPHERILALIGPRRTGKTTLLRQLIQYLLDTNIDPTSILFLSADDPSLKLATHHFFEDIFTIYFDRIKGSSMRETNTYIFIDEIHLAENWEHWLKKYYDLKYPWKFIISSSSATHLSHQSKESLLGRITEFTILPLDFKGYLHLQQNYEHILKYYQSLLEKQPKKTTYFAVQKHEQTLKQQLHAYLLRGGFPEALQQNSLQLWHDSLLSDVLQKTLYRDFIDIYHIREPSKLEEVFTFITYNTSQTFSLSSISRNLGISIEAVTNYLHYLLDAYLIGDLRLYAPTIEKQLRANKKYFIIDPGLHNAIVKRTSLHDKNLGLLIESVVQKHLYNVAQRHHGRLFYWKTKKETDILVSLGDNIHAFEVKYQTTLTKGDFKGLTTCMDAHKLQEGILITKNTLEKHIIDEKTLLCIPAWLFLLSPDFFLEKESCRFL